MSTSTVTVGGDKNKTCETRVCVRVCGGRNCSPQQNNKWHCVLCVFCLLGVLGVLGVLVVLGVFVHR